MAKISVENLLKEFSQFKLDIKKIDLTSDNIYYLQGLNGSGKSVFLRILSRFDKKFKGKIDYNMKTEKILYLTNFDISFPYLTNFENIDTFHSIYGLNADMEKVKLLYGEHSESQLETMSKESSLGMRIKTSLSLVFNSNFWGLIILDETISAIDVKSKEIIYKELEKRQEEGSIVVITSHTDDNLNGLNCKKIYIENGEIYGE